MDLKNIIIMAASIALVGFSIYKKFYKKNFPHTQDNSNELNSGRDDDYEPYSSGR